MEGYLSKVLKTVRQALDVLYNKKIDHLELQETKKEFEGDLTLVTFSLSKLFKESPQQIAEKIGNYLKNNLVDIEGYNVVNGFLNISLSDKCLINDFNRIRLQPYYGLALTDSKGALMVEYSSPNTNKPLHLGHVRNNLLGHSISRILEAYGHKVYKTQIINDRGIHICKSMVAYKKYGKGETPASASMKGDALVGKYYVLFDKEYKVQIAELQAAGFSEEEAEKKAAIILEAQEMLRLWEAGDEEVRELWRKMNSWVYEGFDVTYSALGVAFDSYYYESDTYLLGKEYIDQGLSQGVFYKKKDGSVWCDLTDEGLDEKLLLRADGTAVYMTQDIGTAVQRVKDHKDISSIVYTVGNEQDHHFKVLFLILKKLGFPWAENLYHLSYGMVDLPSGKMKSREGTVVDADDLIMEMKKTAKEIAKEKGKLDGYNEDEKENIYRIVGLGALKYFILKVDPKKRILFNPMESVQFEGNTGPFIQYTYSRTQAILRSADFDIEIECHLQNLETKERDLIKRMVQFPEVIAQAALTYNPALVANYLYELVKDYNSFYQNHSVFMAETEDLSRFRVQLTEMTGKLIAQGCYLLGMEVPERM